jgi:flagellar hook assembly protein FlgD
VELEIPNLKTHLFEAYPNPFNPQTTIAFDFPKRESVTLRVFDMSGRLVRSLITAELNTPGRHEVVWNGRDDSGRKVASGTYFYRLETGNYTETKRMALIK